MNRAERRRQKKADEKSQTACYHFTHEQLIEHDRIIGDRAVERRKEEIDAAVRKEWESRAREFATSDMNENFMNAVAYMFAIPCRVLIEQFGWKPVRFKNCPATRTERLAVAMIEELTRITENEKKDIRTYARETFEKYGLKFVNDFVFNEGDNDS